MELIDTNFGEPIVSAVGGASGLVYSNVNLRPTSLSACAGVRHLNGVDGDATDVAGRLRSATGDFASPENDNGVFEFMNRHPGKT